MGNQQSNASVDQREKKFSARSFRISEMISAYAKVSPSHSALVFLENGEEQSAALDYQALHQCAMAVAAELQRRGLRGERVLLLMPSGLEYVLAFLGCLYAGVVAVPVYPPRNNWHADRVRVIARDAGAGASLILSEFAAEIRASLHDVTAGAPEAVIAIDRIDYAQAGFIDEQVTSDTLAYLQYTSGSTGTPKGVMVSHGDLLKNCALYSEALGLKQGETLVSWLPIFHDMGLVQGIMMPLTLGGCAVFMPPAAMVQKPLRWLRAISRYRAAFSGGPNFSYELCASRISEEEAATLDLSCWRAALNAAEPISPATVRRFAEKFSSSGLQADALIGGFGLAEATLYVTCGQGGEASPELWIAKASLEQGEVAIGAPRQAGHQALISSGRLGADPEVRIVDADSGRPCAPSRIGEIWVGGSSVCRGYWQRVQESEDTFGAALPDRDGRRYMRTGDLGFIHDGQLYVTGRLKDLIIIRGANHYPQDIEASAEHAHPALRKGGWGAAFTLEDDFSGQRLIVVQEVERTARKKVDVNEAGLAVMQAVTAQHGIDVDTVVLVEPAGVPKTSSGKIQRKSCKKLFLAGELNEIGRWERPAVASVAPGKNFPIGHDHIAIEATLRALIARLTALPAEMISLQQPFSALGLNSLKLVEMVAELGDALHLALAPTVAFEYPTIERLAAYLAGSAIQLPALERGDFEAIAIVGMSCRFPGADNPEQFWEMLKTGQSAVAEMSVARRAMTGYRASAADAFRWGGFLNDVDAFDAALFGISPREAQSIDPQQRLLLETAWHALESAGIAPNRLAGSATGVFVGISSNDYFRLQCDAGAGQDTYSGTGSALSIAANRISYCLGLQGPSMALDTACSSSLVAVHQACRSLAGGETELALAGGVNLVLSPDYGVIFSEAKMLSPSGRCHTFGAAADGYVRGEGCGVVVLKRLRDAERDGDQILGVIRGSAINQDGPSNGLTAPNGQAQQQVIRSALRRAGLAPDAIGYIETHGTGTPLGDPIEVAALKNVLDGASTAPCWLGAVKPNIGHLEPAAGIAGLIKTLLVLQRGQIPPVATPGVQNPHIDLTGSRLRIPRELQTWSGDGRRYAGISSFGFGGTNAHLIVEAAPAQDQPQSRVAQDALLLNLSANSVNSLRGLAQSYAARIEESEAVAVAICEAANVRGHLPHRLAVAASEPRQIVAALKRFAAQPDATVAGLHAGRARQNKRTAFLFTGQGAQYAGMGRELYRSEPAFKDCIDRCEVILLPLLGQSLCDMLFGEQAALLDDTRYAQPALVALELALAELWKHYGVLPELVCGHSVGEYAAACVAGLFDLDTTLRLVVLRGRLMASAPGQGAMLSVAASEQRALALLAESGSTLEIAAVNAAEQLVLSGTVAEIESAATLFAGHGIDASRLKVSHAFHSRLMEPILDEFRAALATVEFHPMTLRMMTCGGDTAVDHPAYWIGQLRHTVRFGAAIDALVQAGADTFIEAGPLPVLSRFAARSAADATCIASMRKDGAERLHFLEALGALFVAGIAPRFTVAAPKLRPVLPPYVFDRSRYWFSPGTGARREPAAASIAGRRLDIALEDIACFETTLPNDATSYLQDHKLRGHAVMPGAGYASLMLTAAGEAGIPGSGAPLALQALEFFRPLVLTQDAVRVQTIIQRGPQQDAKGALPRGWLARVLAWDPLTGNWECHASGKLYSSAQQVPAALANDAASRPGQDTTQFYAHWVTQGLEYGPRFQALRELRLDGHKVHALLVLPLTGVSATASVLHPVLLDAAFQAVGALLGERREYQGLAPLPTGIDELLVFRPASGVLRIEAQLSPASTPQKVVADLMLYDQQGTPVARVRGLHLSMISLAALLASLPAPDTGAADAPQVLATQWIAAPAATPSNAKPWLLLAEAGAAPLAPSDTLQFHTLAADFGNLQPIVSTLRNAALAPAAAAGLLLSLEPDHADDDAIERCLFLCRQLQQVLAELAGSGDLPAGFRLCLLTRAAESTALTQAGVAAMWRSAALEYPGLALSQIDLPQTPEQADLQLLGAALSCSDESHLSIRDARLQVPRLQALQMPAQAKRAPIRKDGAYLITGGTGGIGLALADWLAAAGAGRIVLTSRHAAGDQRAAQLIEQWRARGVEIALHQADVSRDADVAALCEELAAAPLPLRGIFHAAGVLRDRPLAQLSEADWRETMHAKAKSALLLDRHGWRFKLDHFVLFSSIVAGFGSAGQCNYAAANGVLDALAARRAGLGLCAATINWGPWAEIGMASDAALAQRLSRQGLLPMAPPQALAALGRVLDCSSTRTAIAAIDWPRFGENLPLAAVPSLLRGMTKLGGNVQASDQLISLDAIGALDNAAAGRAIRQALAALLRQVLRMHEGGPLADGSDPREVRLSSLGVDSLMATELRNRVRAWVNVDLPAHLLIGNSSLEEVADLIYQKVLLGYLSTASQEADAAAGDGEEFVL